MHGRNNFPGGLLLALGVAASILAFPISAAAADEPARIDELVKQLNHERFQIREAATEALIETGRECVKAVVEAAQSGVAEVEFRAMRVLTAMSISDKSDDAAAAIEGLEQLAESDNEVIARRAEGALEKAVILAEQQATEALRDLGVVFQQDPENPGHVAYATLRNAEVTDEHLRHLKRLRHLRTVQIQQTEVDDPGVDKIIAALPNAAILHPNAAFLGIAMPQNEERCVVSSVVPGSPAARAGLQELDIITKLDGREVHGNQGLLFLVSRRKPGERIAMQVERGEETVEVNAVLGRRESVFLR